jgi:predicted nucleic acid-binding protein
MPVVDTSVVMAVILAEPDADRARIALNNDHLHAPDLLVVEAANALIKAARRGRMSPDQVQPRLNFVRTLRVIWHPTTDLVSRATDIALTWNRHPYDGIFVALAEHLKEPLITGDHALVRGLAGTPVERWVKVMG